MEVFVFLIPPFFVTAWVYASAGLGGGSTYLALLFLFQFGSETLGSATLPYTALPKVALLCNLVVVSGGLYHYIRSRNLSLSLVLPFCVSSLPFSYLGGRISISKEHFLGLLGFSLLIAGTRMIFSQKLVSSERGVTKRTSWFIGLPVGAALGFLSGLVGIGGGIFLAPILYFMGWGKPKQIAAAASFFIFINSLFGLMGQWTKEASFIDIDSYRFFLLLLAVFLGGQVGSRFSVGRLSSFTLQRITAILILATAGRIFWKFL
ncbi:MAG: sulfite exporter TauE/SafE family protein [Deltaproteobacteria bacterium]|nr:sulfite exporter TauE/SafE family protein [Deltaproteobacteria bacterium]MBI3017940.1 sulfite exporter TauE/SafE family protein [Deltaproteobacteria bacterium]